MNQSRESSPNEQGMIFRNREHAGEVLAGQCEVFKKENNLLILGLPRGGVPVAFQLAKRLRAPMDIFMVRKVGAPGQEELAMGAVASNEVTILNQEIIDMLHLPKKEVDDRVNAERLRLLEQEKILRGETPKPAIRNKQVLLVDDGLATGASMKSAVTGVQSLHPANIAVAVPVGAPQSVRAMSSDADEVICAYTPDLFRSVGQWYADFSAVENETVHALLIQANQQFMQ